jgi:type IV pilus assembly protein PilB
VLRADVAALTFQRLGLPKEIEPRVIHALHAQGKLLLTTGPTGSGKTTTLYTCLNYLRDGTNNIETVEDPVEFRIPGISQIQVNEAIDVTFASALRSVLRQDPDVIMVGEIRDEETADIALQAAQTGHLVLSSLHTNDAPSAVARLVNLGVDTYSIATGLAGVLAQRLVRRVCERCRVADDTIPPEILEKLKAALGPETSFLRGTGCAACRHTGFKGRVGLFSYLQITEALAELIHQKASMATLIDEAKRDGYRDLEEGAFDLLERGITSWAEVADYIAFADEPAPQPPLPAQDAPEGTRALKRIKVLLIDDDPDMRAVFSLVLSREAYEVIEAENGLDGLNKLYQHTPDLVLCDLMMPVMDGREFLLKIRGNADTRTIPVVMLTAANS